MTRSFVHDSAAVRVLLRPGALTAVAGETRRLGDRAVVIATTHAKPYADRVADDLGDALVGRIDGVVMHVPVAVADAAVARTRLADANVVVAIGGGSSIGLAKAVALETDLPIVAVPTTYSGSEMTPIWGLTDGRRKTTGRDSKVLPRTVVYDPELTTSLPADVSAASGINALAHCVEGLYSAAASPVTSLLAEEAIRALVGALPKVVEAPHDTDARSDSLYGAWLAGWVLGTAVMGVHHKVCHVLGGTFGLPHAAVHSAVLPYAVAYNSAWAEGAMQRAASAIGTENAASGLWELARRIGAPTSLAAVGFNAGDADEAARIVTERPFENPRPVDQESVRAMLLAAYRGDAPIAT